MIYTIIFDRDEDKLSNGQNTNETGPGSDGKNQQKRSTSPVTHNGAYVGVSTSFNKGNVKSKNLDRLPTPTDKKGKRGKHEKQDEIVDYSNTVLQANPELAGNSERMKYLSRIGYQCKCLPPIFNQIWFNS